MLDRALFAWLLPMSKQANTYLTQGISMGEFTATRFLLQVHRADVQTLDTRALWLVSSLRCLHPRFPIIYEKHGKGHEGTGAFVDIDGNDELEAHDITGDAEDGLDDDGPTILPATGKPGASPFDVDDM